MRDVVDDLLANGAEALLELQELRQAVTEILRRLSELALATRGLCLDLENLPTQENPTAVACLRAVQRRAALLSPLAEQILAAFRQLDLGMQGWGMDGEDDESPRSLQRPR